MLWQDYGDKSLVTNLPHTKNYMQVPYFDMNRLKVFNIT